MGAKKLVTISDILMSQHPTHVINERLTLRFECFPFSQKGFDFIRALIKALVSNGLPFGLSFWRQSARNRVFTKRGISCITHNKPHEVGSRISKRII